MGLRLFSVNLFMTLFAKCYSIGYLIAEIRIVSERFNVMSVEIASFIVSAFLTGKSVSKKYIVSPSLVFDRESCASYLFRFPMFVRCALFTSFCSTPLPLTHSSPRFKIMLLSLHRIWPAHSNCGHSRFGFWSMFLPLKCARSTFAIDLFLNSSTSVTSGCQTISSRGIGAKEITRLPLFAFITPLKSHISELKIRFQRHISGFCGKFSRTDRSLRHG